MTIKKALHLRRTDLVVCCYAEPASGPGWSNRPLWVIVRDENGILRSECLQPEDHPKDVALLYGIAAQVHGLMLQALEE